MKYLALIFAFALAMFTAACGNNSLTGSTSVSGTWTDSLTNSTGQSLGTVAFTLSQTGSTMQGLNMNFKASPALSQCFGPNSTTMTGQINMQLGMTGMANTMTMTVTGNPSGGSVNNTLIMQGAMNSNMNSGTGTYTLTGNTAGCTSQSGVFTMSRQ